MEAPNHPAESYILNVPCVNFFCPRLLIDEYDYLQESITSKLKVNDNDNTPTLNDFCYLVKIASTRRPHILKTVTMYISDVWSDQYLTTTKQL